MADPLKVLFLCATSALSVMAEAILNHRSKGRFLAFSAASHPAPSLRAEAIRQIQSAGISTANLQTRSWSDFTSPGAPAIDFVINFCENASSHLDSGHPDSGHLVSWPGQPAHAHWCVSDPASVEGTPDEIACAFREAFATLDRSIGSFVWAQEVGSLPPDQRELLARTAQFETLLNQAPIGILLVNADLVVLEANPVAVRDFEVSDLRGLNLVDILHHKVSSERADQIVGVYRETLRTGQMVKLDEGKTPDDEYYDWQIHRIPLPDGTAGVVCYFRNVSARRRSLDALRENEERLRSIFSTTLGFIGLLTPEGTVLDCNRAALQLGDVQLEGVVGRRIWDCAWFVHTPGIPERVCAAVRQAAAGETCQTEMVLLTPRGEVVTLHYSMAPVKDDDGRVVFLVAEAQDITEMKRTEAALTRSDRLAAVGRLATSIAHEINNPLEAVTNLLYLAERCDDHAQTREFLSIAERELARISSIANQILSFHKQGAFPAEVSPQQMFAAVLRSHAERLGSSEIAVVSRHRATRAVRCFEGEIIQVLNNLVVNAIDAMNGGGRLLVRSCQGRDWRTNRRGVVLTVADSGHGMEPVVTRHIFEPSFTTKGIRGNGLGLWISNEIAMRHEGRIAVRSRSQTPPTGTVFRLFLPYSLSELR